MDVNGADSLTEALALVRRSVHEDLGGDDGAKGQKHLHELVVSELLRQVVDEEVGTFRTCQEGAHRVALDSVRVCV